MSESTPEQLSVTFSMTSDDYARYFAIGRRQGSGWIDFFAYIVMFFCAIPVALAFRSFAAQSLDDATVLTAIGYSSLLAFMLGILAAIAWMVIMRRFATTRALNETLNAFGARTVVFDATAVSLKGQLAEASWRWAAVNRITHENGLFLIWVGGATPVCIPSRSFGSDSQRMAVEAFIRARMAEAAKPGGQAAGAV